MKIWLMSDTHSKHLELDLPDPSEVDMVIHAGDAGSHRELSQNDAELREFLTWYNNLPYKYKIYIPGNHDTSIEQDFHDFNNYPDIIVLIHKSIEIEGIKIFGSPYTPSFGTGWAYNVARHKLDIYWEQIPDNTDLVITHGPPKGILDYIASNNTSYEQVGCKSLLNNIKRVNPKYHIFGHIHDESNVLNCGLFKPNDSKLDTVFINACVMNSKYEVINNGILIDY